MTAADPPTTHAAIDDHICCEATLSARSRPHAPDVQWHRAAQWARRLSWASLVWMLTEGVVGLWQGLIVGSIALTGWALGSAVEGLASVIVIWRFTGSRTLSETAERRAQRGVAVSFWLLAPYIAAVLTGLAITASWPGGWWLDPLIGLGIAAAAVWEGIQSWRGDDCCAC
jgi:divalent metal cation (Fe/Co/Zn/Cd) transporter